MSSRVDDRSMHELYLWPFADSVKAGVASVMCSYNKINGQSVPLAVVSFFVFLLFFFWVRRGWVRCNVQTYVILKFATAY